MKSVLLATDRVLVRWDYRESTAADGEQAFGSAKPELADSIILDLPLSKVGGRDVLPEPRKHPLPACPSHGLEQSARNQCRKMPDKGAFPYLEMSKPDFENLNVPPEITNEIVERHSSKPFIRARKALGAI